MLVSSASVISPGGKVNKVIKGVRVRGGSTVIVKRVGFEVRFHVWL